MKFRLCAVRCDEPDEHGRLVTAEVVTLNPSTLLRVAHAIGGCHWLDGARALAVGLEDTPEVREALGLKPREVFARGKDAGHTGVAGVME